MKIRAALLLVAVAVLAACSKDASSDSLGITSSLTGPGSTTGPSNTAPGDTVGTPGDTVGTPGDTVSTPGDTVGTPPDTIGTPPDTGSTPTDTTGVPYPGVVHLSGHVLAQTGTTPLPGGTDSLVSVAIAGATVKLYRNVLVGGVSTSVYVAETTSNAGGSYQFSGLPGGYYLLRTHVPSGPAAGDYLHYVAANAPEVRVDISIWTPN